MEKMGMTRFLFVLFILCAVLVKAAEIDDAVCSKTVEGSTAEYDDDGEFLGCVNFDEDYEIDHDEDDSSSEHPYECKGDGYIDPKTGTQQCCPSTMHFEINPYFPTEGGCCPLGQAYVWDSGNKAFSCQHSLNDQGTGLSQQPGNLGSSPGYPYPDPRYPDPRYPDPRYPDPRYPDPRYPDPRYPDPRYPGPGRPYPGYPYPDLTCPYANQRREVVDGVIYKLLCHRGHGTRTRVLMRFNANTALECLEACSADRRCTAANFWWNKNSCSLATGRVILGPYRTRDRVLGAIVRGHVRAEL